MCIRDNKFDGLRPLLSPRMVGFMQQERAMFFLISYYMTLFVSQHTQDLPGKKCNNKLIRQDVTCQFNLFTLGRKKTFMQAETTWGSG